MRGRLTQRTWKSRLKSFLSNHRWILLLMLLLFVERLVVLAQLGLHGSVGSDDLSYLQSGITFLQTGTISMHDSYPSAQIMPGMTVFIGVMSLFFGQGDGLWLALKLVWFLLGTLSAYYTYKAVCLFAPRWCSLAAAAWYLAPNVAWMDNMLLTETPFICFSVASVYYTFCMGREPASVPFWKSRPFWCCAGAYFLAFLLKANYGIYPLFAAIYLLLVKYDWKRLLKQGLILGGVMLVFLVPWTIRNYVQFHAFIPLTYGAGNPALLGTYQGYGYPADEDLDYTIHVDQVVKEKYADYYGPDGEILPQYVRYVNLEADGVKADYRKAVWWETAPKSMLVSYLVIKPWDMVQSVFYWQEVLLCPYTLLKDLRGWNLLVCAAAAVLAFALKKRRAEVFSLGLMYVANLYIYAMTFSFDRYAESLMPLRNIAFGIGLYLLCHGAAAALRSVRQFDTQALDKGKKG